MPTYECKKCGMSVNATCGKLIQEGLNKKREVNDIRNCLCSRLFLGCGKEF
jgi:hypothetical protein